MRSSASLWFVATVLFLLTASSANAGNPLFKSSLNEFDKDGHEINSTSSFSLTLFAKGKSKKPGYFNFTEDRHIVCIKAPCPSVESTDFTVRTVGRDQCGSTLYIAQSKQHGNRLTVMDHSTRVCDDYQKYRWQVSLYGPRYSKRFFAGNPATTVASDSCLAKLENTICTANYMPTDCSASTIDGQREKIDTIKASGSNGCHAANLLKQQACAFGIEPERFQDGDIICSASAPPVVLPAH